MKNKNIAIDGSGKAFIESGDLGDPGEGQLQVKMEKSQISVGTEMMGVMPRRKNPNPAAAPMRPGYSISGTVIKTGTGVDGFSEGDRVMTMGAGNATHALYSNVNQNLTLKMPAAVSFEEGAYVALALTAMQAVRRLDPEFGKTYIIAGLGLVGQLSAQILSAAGCAAVGLDISAFRNGIADNNGIDLTVSSLTDESSKKDIFALANGDGVDGGIICFGGDGTETLKSIYNLMITPPDSHRFGPIVVVGGCVFNNLMLAAALGNVDIRSAARTGPGYKDDSWERGRDYPKGWVRWDTQRNMRYFSSLLVKKRMNVTSLTTHTFKLDDAPNVYDGLADGSLKDSLGIFFEP
ncbi:MAG: zinc-binding alcohol dehydrogenase [Spirochaetes bacterium]|nr:zinc-binding alcohol dehydrogenase [Spirochaetota bacterium]